MLPVNFYNEDFLCSITRNLGTILRIHEATLAWTQTQEALACIDLDISKPRHDWIWIGCDANGFGQKINYHRVPSLCALYHKLGHNVDSCSRKLKRDVSKNHTGKGSSCALQKDSSTLEGAQVAPPKYRPSAR